MAGKLTRRALLAIAAPLLLSSLAFGSGGLQVEYVISNNWTIKQFGSSGVYYLQFGGPGTGNGQFMLASGIAVDPNTYNVWVSDALLNRVQEFDYNGNYITQFGSTGTAPGKLYQPYGLTVDTSSNVWVADTGNNRIQEFTSAGAFVQSFGSLGGAPGQFNVPVGISTGSVPNLWVSDTGNNRIQVFTLNGGIDAAHLLFLLRRLRKRERPIQRPLQRLRLPLGRRSRRAGGRPLQSANAALRATQRSEFPL